MAFDVSRLTEGVYLPVEEASEIWSRATDNSIIMNNAQRMVMPGSGRAIDLINSMPSPAWVGETDHKPNGAPTLANMQIVPYKMAIIIPFSDEFRRDKEALYSAIVEKAPAELGRYFDRTVFDSTVPAPGANFDKLSGATAVSIADDAYGGFVEADGLVAANGGSIDRWILSAQGRTVLYGERDADGRPLFNDSTADGSIGAVLGRPVYLNKNIYVPGTPNIVGIGGDWSSARWGSVEGIKMSYSNQTSITIDGTLISLFEHNMFAVKLEMEVAFRVIDEDDFVLLTDEAAPAGGGE